MNQMVYTNGFKGLSEYGVGIMAVADHKNAQKNESFSDFLLDKIGKQGYLKK